MECEIHIQWCEIATNTQKLGCMDSVDWNGGMEWWTGLDWTGLDWNGMAGCNFVIKFCGRDQTLTCIQASLATNALVQWKHDMNIKHKL